MTNRIELVDGTVWAVPHGSYEWLLRNASIADIYKNRFILAEIIGAFRGLLIDNTTGEAVKTLRQLRRKLKEQEG